MTPPKWSELTPQAQAVMLRDLDRLLAQAPAQQNVALVREAVEANPDLIPSMLDQLRALGAIP